jgi:hypothetical protein
MAAAVNQMPLLIFEIIAKEGARRQALLHKKKEQGGKPCSKNCVDPIFPKIWI